jgi:hypothetical protein
MSAFPGPQHLPRSPINSNNVDERLQTPSQGDRVQIFMAVHQGGSGRLGLAWYDSSTAEVGSTLADRIISIVYRSLCSKN